MDKWLQVYDPLGSLVPGFPAYLLSALVAAIPLYILFYMLAVKRSPGHKAAIVGTLSAVILAILVWGMPVGLAVNSTIMGACFGLFPIVWIVITAVWVYNMTVESGEFEIIKNSLASLTDDRRLQAILIAFAFGSFIEGTAGFGTPVAITAAMLVGLGFNPLYAAGICLIANTAPVAFGAIGVPVVVAAQVAFGDSHEHLMHVTKIVGRQLPFLSIIVPFWLCCTMSGFKRALEVLPAVIVAGMSFAITQYLSSNFHGPYLPDIISAIVTIIAIVMLLRVWRPANPWRFPDEAPASGERVKCDYSLGEVLRAWGPYIVLALTVFVWGLQTFKDLVAFTVVKFPWPSLHNMIAKTAPIVAQNTDYGAVFNLNIATAGGTAILISGIISCLFIPNYGFGKAIPCFFRTCYTLRFPVLTIAMILGLAYIMNYSGMSSTMGLAFTATGSMFAFFAPILGWLGVFLTGSDTSSNALFCGLQKTTALEVGMDQHLATASNTTGGVTGKMISPQSISVATAATGMVGQEGNLFRFTLFHSMAMLVVICIITYLQSNWLHWMLPATVIVQ